MRQTEALAWIRDELLRLVAIPSRSGDEAAVVGHLEELASRLDLPTHIEPVAGCGPNLIVGWHPRPQLLLSAHTDTVTPTWDWRSKIRTAGHIVHGLGSQDDKGCIIACMLAFVLARDAGVDLEKLSAGLGFCADEEEGGRGSLHMAAQVEPEYVVALEGTSLRIATIEAGYVQGWADVGGIAAHHALVEEGRNAIEAAAGLVLALKRAPLTRVLHPTGAANAVSILSISSPAILNRIPDQARLYIEARIFGPHGPAEVADQLGQICAAHHAEFTLDDASGWYETSPEAPLTVALSSALTTVLGVERALTSMPARTDGHSFATVAGAQTVVFGPGNLRTAHGPNEHIDVREILACARVLAQLLDGAHRTLGITTSSAPLRRPSRSARRSGES
jgi:acetylornithine deacetylase/succinyl-diaminopimelate desuccinylase-like protein